MSNDTPKSDIKKAYDRSYEENPDDKVALQKAIESVPVKDYSDYEITIENKVVYDDALYQDDQTMLDAAASSTAKKPAPAEHTSKPGAGSTATPTPKTTANQAKSPLRFLTANTQAQCFNSQPVALHISGINQSIPNPTCLVETLVVAQPELPKIEQRPATQPPPSAKTTIEQNEHKPLSTVNTLLKKIHSKAAEKITLHKEHVDEYLGRSLPVRELALNFQTPRLKPIKEVDELYSESKMVELLQGKKIKNTLLSRCEQALNNLVKADLSSHKKAAVFSVTEQAVAERSRSLISSLERKPCFSEDPSRAEAVKLCLLIIRHLINGYKQLYSQLYQANNLIYGPQRDKANQYAFTLVELLCLEQRLCIACHQNTAEVNLRTFNNLYLGLAMYEPEQLNLQRHANCLAETTTIQTLFINYQLLAALQTQQLSASLHKTMKAYLLEHQSRLNILAIDHNQRLQQPTWCIEHDHSSQAVLVKHLKVKNEHDWPCVYIQLQGLLSAVKTDYRNVLLQISGQAPSQALSNSLEQLNPRQKLVMLSMLNHCVSRIESASHPAQFSRYEPENCQVYNNLDDAISLLHFESYQQLATKTKNDLKPEKPIAAKSKWSVAHEDEHSIYLQTNELKSKLALDIGHVLLLSKTISEDDQSSTHFRIGHIVSLQRDNNGNLFIHLQKYGEDSAAIKIQSKQNTIEAIICDGSDQKYLILQKAPYLKPSTALAISFDCGLKTTIVIDQLVTVTEHCYVYRLN